MKTNLFLIAFTASTFLAAAEKMFTVDFKGYPKSKLSCADTAQAVGKEFEAQTKLRVVSARCARENWASYDLTVGYAAEQKALLIPSAPWPMHTSYEACQKNLASEQAAFASVTGLSSFLGHCALFLEQSGFKSFRRYTVAAMVYGIPKAIPRSVQLKMMSGKYLGPKGVEQEIVEKAKLAGFNAVAAYLDGRESESDVWIRVLFPDLKSIPLNLTREFSLEYSVEPFHIVDPYSSPDPMKMDTAAQCANQAEIAKKTFSTVFPEPVVWLCMWDPYLFRAQLYNLRIGVSEASVLQYIPGEDGEPFNNFYKTHEECEADKAKVTPHYQKKYGSDYVGALCSWPVVARPKIPTRMFIYVAQ